MNWYLSYLKALLISARSKSAHQNYSVTATGRTINHLINKYDLSESDCTYFGDTEGDAAACHEAGVDFVYVSWGYGDAKEMANLKCLTMNGWDELCGFIGRVQLAE
mgnify:CR=1 FL=1